MGEAVELKLQAVITSQYQKLSTWLHRRVRVLFTVPLLSNCNNGCRSFLEASTVKGAGSLRKEKRGNSLLWESSSHDKPNGKTNKQNQKQSKLKTRRFLKDRKSACNYVSFTLISILFHFKLHIELVIMTSVLCCLCGPFFPSPSPGNFLFQLSLLIKRTFSTF